MDITILAAWGEFLGGIAVVVSLVYLASQIRQNSKLLRASTSTVTQQVTSQLNILLAQDDELSRIYWEGMADRAALSEANRRRFDSLVAIAVNGFQQHLRLFRDGLVSSEIWDDQKQYMRWSSQQPGFRQWWLLWAEEIYKGDLQEFINVLIREGEAAG